MSALDFCDNVDNDYGVDPDGPIPTDDVDCNGITIPQTTLKFSEADSTSLQQAVGPLAPSSDNYEIDLNEQTLSLITTFTPGVYKQWNGLLEWWNTGMVNCTVLFFIYYIVQLCDS